MSHFFYFYQIFEFTFQIFGIKSMSLGTAAMCIKSRGPILRVMWPETCSVCVVLTNQGWVFKFCLSHVAHFFLWNYDFNWRLHNWLCRKPRLFGWNLYLYFFDRSTSVNKQNYLYRGPCSSWFWNSCSLLFFFQALFCEFLGNELEKKVTAWSIKHAIFLVLGLFN